MSLLPENSLKIFWYVFCALFSHSFLLNLCSIFIGHDRLITFKKSMYVSFLF